MFPTAYTTGPVQKPNRISTPESDKDEKYHLDFAKFCTGSLQHPSQRIYQVKTLVNWNFYQNNQWLFEEDLESFLKDESGDVRNRIRWQRNIIQPMVQEYIGNAIRTDFSARAISVSDFVTNRREQELSRLQFFTRIAENSSPEMKETIKKNLPVGENESETQDIFENMWVDEYERTINNLLKYEEAVNDFDQAKVTLAQHLALGGLAVMKGIEKNGEHVWTPIDPIFYFFDYGARRKDLKDAEFMGEIHYMTSPDINERWQDLPVSLRQTLEKYSSSYTTATRAMFHYVYGDVTNKIPVYEVYWKDIEKEEFGFVRDRFGYEFFTKINSKDSEYKTKDLITPRNEKDREYLKGKKSRIIYRENIRFCFFIAKEYMGGGNDIVLDYGSMPYQESTTLKPSHAEFPYKCSTWDYHNGLILAPVDVVIDSQRIINRALSMAEAQMNNSRGAGTVIDRSALDGPDAELETEANVNNSKTIFVDSRGRGVQNVVGSYDSTMKESISYLYDISDRLASATIGITGVTEQMAGTQGNPKKTIPASQPGMLINENFYYCLSQVFEQVYQAIASQGKMIYADSPRKLSIITGDAGAQQIVITKDMCLEDFRVFIRRVGSEAEDKFMANQTLLQMRMAGMLEEAEFTKYYNHASMDDISRALRESYKRRNLASKAQLAQQQEVVQQNNQNQQQAVQSAEAKQKEMLQIQLDQNEKDRQLKLDSIRLRAFGALAKQREAARLKAQYEK